eukprot:5425981-Prymnesium_polylepis.1
MLLCSSPRLRPGAVAGARIELRGQSCGRGLEIGRLSGSAESRRSAASGFAWSESACAEAT